MKSGISLCTLVFFLCNLNGISQTITENMFFETNVKQMVGKGVVNNNGFNAAFAFNKLLRTCSPPNHTSDLYFEGLPNNCASVSKCYYEPVVNLSKDLNFTILRFPGGTISNCYHYGVINASGCNTNKLGYGRGCDCNVSTLPDNSVADPPSRNYIFDFIDYIKQLSSEGRTVRVLYVLNIYAHFKTSCHAKSDQIGSSAYNSIFNENMNAIKLLADNGIQIAGFEFGNELGYSQFSSVLNANTYLNICANYADYLETNYPDVKRGICANTTTGYDNAGVWGAESPDKIQWNQNLNTKLLENNGLLAAKFDALIIHSYYTDTPEEVYLGSNNLVSALTEIPLSVFPELFENYNYKVWLTEWNVLKESRHTYTGDPSQEMANALYEVDVYNRMVNNNGLKGLVEFNCLHNLVSTINDTWTNSSGAICVANNLNSPIIVKKTVGLSSQLYNELFLNQTFPRSFDEYISPNVPNSKFRYTSYYDGKGYVYTYFTNFSDYEILINPPTYIFKEAFAPYQVILGLSVLEASTKLMKAPSIDSYPEENVVGSGNYFFESNYDFSIPNTKILIPKYSTGYIKSKINDTYQY